MTGDVTHQTVVILRSEATKDLLCGNEELG
jgi:hypothetical protein